MPAKPQRLATRTRDDTLRTLHANTERMARFIDRLRDEDLRREVVGFHGLILADEIERGLIGHLQVHARAVRLALIEGRASTPGAHS